MRQKVWREDGHRYPRRPFVLRWILRCLQSCRVSVCLATTVLVLVMFWVLQGGPPSLGAAAGTRGQEEEETKAPAAGQGATSLRPGRVDPAWADDGAQRDRKREGDEGGATPPVEIPASGVVAGFRTLPPARRNAHRANYAVIYLTFGCLAFGCHLFYCLCCGGGSSAVSRALRVPLYQFRGRSLNGVHLAEFAASAWCIGCVLTADYLHFALVAPAATRCVRGVCASRLEVLLAHVLPSLYINGTFFFNWFMCVRGARPEDAYTEEQRVRLFATYRDARARQGGDVDSEHWAAEGGMHIVEDSGQKHRRAGPMGTDGNMDRGHMCWTCNAFVVRSDHHCPCLGVCVGAHNQTYFVGVMLMMTLAMWYGAAVSYYAARRCFSLEGPDTGHCRQLITVIFAVSFLAVALASFTSAVLFLCAVDLTIREALALEVLRFKAGPLFVWRKIASNATVGVNLQRVLGASIWGLLLPIRRPPSVLTPLRLPPEEELAAAYGVYYVVGENGEETWV